MLLALPVVNHVLAKNPITIPARIIPLFEFSNLTLDYFDDYIYAGMTPKFIAPTSNEGVFIQ